MARSSLWPISSGQPVAPFPRPACGSRQIRNLFLAAEQWGTFQVTEIAPDGMFIRQGGLLLRMDTTRLDRRIRFLKRHILRIQRLLSRHRATGAERVAASSAEMAALRQHAVAAGQTEIYFRTRTRAAKQKSAATAIRRTGLLLARQLQEYRVLFTLERTRKPTRHASTRALELQQDLTAASEFCLGMEVLNHRKILENQLPREASFLAHAAEEARHRYDAARENHSRLIRASRGFQERHENRLWKHCEMLVALERDRGLCTLCAPTDGIFHHQSPGAQHSLTTGQPLVPGHVFATFVPCSAAELAS